MAARASSAGRAGSTGPAGREAGRRGRARDGGAAAPCRDSASAAVAAAISAVAARALTESRLREVLARRFDEAAVDAAVGRLKELRLIDDPAWAERFARDRSARMGRGRHRIRGELLARGIDAATADAAIATALDEDAEREAARRALAALRVRLSAPQAGDGPEDGEGSPDHPGNAASGVHQGPAAGGARGAAASASAARKARQALESRLFRRMIARGYPASLVRDLLDVS